MTRRLNLRFLACLLAVCAALGAGGHFLHAYQVQRHVGELRQRAQHAVEGEQYPEAIREYQRYLSMVPNDGNARAEYGLVLDKIAKTGAEKWTVVETLDRALLLQEDRIDVRARLVQVAMDIQRFSDARHHLEKLLETSPKNAEWLDSLGRCLDAEGEYAGAAKQFEKAIKENPTAIDSYVRLTDLWRSRLNKADQTESLMDKMVKASGSARAYVARARYYRQGGAGLIGEREKLPVTLLGAVTGGLAQATLPGGDPNLLFKAGQDLAKARELAPDDADVLLESAELERSLGWLNLARERARHGLELYPEDARMYKEVADLAVLAGQPAEAIDCLRRGVKALSKDTFLLLQLADLLIQKGDLDEAAALTPQLKRQRIAPAILDYLDGRRKFASEKWLDASRTLEAAYPELVHWPEMARKCALLLGRCYEQLGDADQQYGAYRRVLTEDRHDPLWFAAADGVARSLLALNKVEEALDAYRRLMPMAPAARVVMVRLLIVRNLGLPEAQRHWGEVDQLLAEAVRLLPNSVEVAILQVQALAARSQYDEAKRILTAAEKNSPDDVRLSLARAGLAETEGKDAAVLSILDDAEKRFGDRVELRLARARHYVRTGDRATVKLLSKLEEGMDHFREADQQSLQRGLADAYAALDAPAEARRLWEQLAKKKANDVDVRIKLFDLALLTREDKKHVDDLIGEIRHLEGEKGTLWRYCTVAQLIDQAEHGDRKGLDEARPLLAIVSAHRPAWHRVPVCEGRIEELSRNVEGAIARYLRAIDLGERSSIVLLKTIQLLYQRGRPEDYENALKVIRKLPEQAPLLQRMNDVVVDLSLRTKDTENALSVARKAVAEKPGDYRTHLSLGRVFWAMDQRLEAEKSLRKSVELADDVPETWITLVQFLAVKPERVKDAEEVIRQIEAKVPVKKQRLAFAQCYVAVGQLDKARDLYRATLVDNPEDPAALRAATALALRMDKRDEAKQYLKRRIDLKEQSPAELAEARQMLALLLVTEGSDYDLTRKELKKLGFLDPTADRLKAESVEDKRARATILAIQRRRADKQEAIRVFEEVAKLQPLSPSDQFLLAQLYQVMGQWPKARTQMLTLLGKAEVEPAHVAYYARVLLARNEADEAAPWVAKLETLQPGKWLSVELKARLLGVQKRGEDARDLLKEFAKGKDAPLLEIATSLEQIEQTTAAEEIFKKVVSRSDKPETVLVLAGFLARTKRIPAALDVCEQARATVPREKVDTMAVAILYQRGSREADWKRVEQWLVDDLRMATGPARLALQGHLAAIYNLQGRTQEVETIYRRRLEEDRHDSLAMNNLAWLLANTKRNLPEALALIQRAIEITGPRNGFLDTRGTVYLAMGNTDFAVKDLEEVVADNPTALSYFHLAQAHCAAKNKEAARFALQHARQLGLKEKDLPSVERDKYGPLCAAMDMK